MEDSLTDRRMCFGAVPCIWRRGTSGVIEKRLTVTHEFTDWQDRRVGNSLASDERRFTTRDSHRKFMWAGAVPELRGLAVLTFQERSRVYE